ncbi:MAG: helix-turn-helix domain-containing protein [Phycisphaerae bacterium]|nr:helix-turn-helix domain-containing protein [Phycisphaerae bacterium]
MDFREKLLYTYHEVAKILGFSERKVWGLVKSGDLASCKMGRNVRIPSDALMEYVYNTRTQQVR